MSRIAVTGATGLIGRAVTTALIARGDSVIALTRDPERARGALAADVELAQWSSPTTERPPEAALAGADAVVHLLGEPIAQRWTARSKEAIRDSRVLGTRQLVEAISALEPERRPRTLVSQSAIGFYGPLGDDPVDETGTAGSDLLARIVTAWEHEALVAESAGIRVALTRTGVVLARRGGALAKMLPPFRMGVGGPVAGGRQYISWVHLDDVAGAISFCLDEARAIGPVNVTSPSAVSNAEFSRVLGRVLHRPAVLPVPGFALRLLYGEMSEIVTTGQHVVPSKLAELGYQFSYPELEPALIAVLS